MIAANRAAIRHVVAAERFFGDDIGFTNIVGATGPPCAAPKIGRDRKWPRVVGRAVGVGNWRPLR